MTNTNVAANNTTANTTLDNTMNDYAFPCIDELLDTEYNVNPYDANTVMIGEDLADVYQLSATEYVVRGTTCENVHQVVGDNYAGATTVEQRNSEDVFVTLVTDALVELVCVDNAEELAMQAEAAYLAYYEGGVDIEVELELGF